MKYGAEIPALSAADIERFWGSVEKAECWVWTGQTRRGYGRFMIDGKAYAAHRVAWVIEHGGEPDSEVLDHTCGNPPRVNPAHLDDVTQSINSHRGVNGYGSRELCRAGLHDITDPANVKEGSSGRQCRACQNAAKRRYDAKRREDAAFRAAEADRRREWFEFLRDMRAALRAAGGCAMSDDHVDLLGAPVEGSRRHRRHTAAIDPSRISHRMADGVEGMSDILSPDCRDGKCAACTGDAWNDTTDQGCACECACHDTKESPGGR